MFLAAHGELLTGRCGRGVQERLRAGEIVDIFPYRDEQRLHHARSPAAGLDRWLDALRGAR